MYQCSTYTSTNGVSILANDDEKLHTDYEIVSEKSESCKFALQPDRLEPTKLT